MDTLPLPPRPNLDQYRKRAKELVAAANSKDPGAVRAWATDWIETLVELLEVPSSPPLRGLMDRGIDFLEERVREKTTEKGSRLTLADAQFFIARVHSFENWADFARHLDPINHPQDSSFERAANAVVTGDLATLETLIRSNPGLVHQRSTRVHRVTLLHYVAANGVEDWRQKTPPNAVAIAKFLLEAGAEVDAIAETYGGGNAQTTMNLLVSSTHPAEAGLQSVLAETLLDFGAAINGLDDDGSPLMTALSFGYQPVAETLGRRGARIDNIAAAAALGRLDLVKRYVDGDLGIKATLAGLYWIHLPNDHKARNEFALAWACRRGGADVVEFLLNHGVDAAGAATNRMTGLHEAAAHGHLSVIDLLLKHGAPLEVENAWGGTVLNSTLHFALYQPIDGADYPAVIQKLIAAGADLSVVDYPTGNSAIDVILGRGTSS